MHTIGYTFHTLENKEEGKNNKKYRIQETLSFSTRANSSTYTRSQFNQTNNIKYLNLNLRC